MRSWKLLLIFLAPTLCLAAQPDRITGSIESRQMVTLRGSVHPKAQPQSDLGPVDPSYQLGYVTLIVAPSPSEQAALDQLLAQQQDRSSANFHKWLTPEQYAARFGMSQSDAAKITGWLESQGFTVLQVPRGRNSVIFSGTAAQIQAAFNTEIHRYDVNGERHIANSSPLSLPAALSGVVTGVRGLHDFRLKPMYVRPVTGDANDPHPHYTTTIQGNTTYFIAPGDIATLYNFSPLYNATTPIDGTGQKLAIVGQTDIYLADLVDFRTGFNLPSFTCTTGGSGLITNCSTPNFAYVLLGTDPGSPSLGDLFESDLDVEWAGAVARNAQIIFINAETANGVNDALAHAISNTTAPVISMSYGACEREAGTLETELQQANVEGITILNSSGDTGSAECDFNPPGSTNTTTPPPPFALADGGLAVGYPSSSPEVTGVGGTSIPAFSPNDYTSAFWGPTNGTDGGSALTTLIGQEVSWNDDEALADFCVANPTNSFCNPSPGVKVTSAQTYQKDYWISIGGGGVSNCYNPTLAATCTAGFPRPSWQQAITIPGLTSPQSTYRLVPDVSLLASPNYPGYVFCTPVEELASTSPYDTETTSSCASGIATAADGTVVSGKFVINPSIVGGTSASSPVFAGIVTLMNQYLGGSGLGNINPTLYALAATPPNGVFHKVDSGDSNVYCQPNTPSGQPADVICPTDGVFGFDASAASADATTGYNLVTGLGSVDANALAVAWKASLTPDFQFSPPHQSVTVAAGASASVVLTITPISGSSPAVINFSPSSCAGLPTGASCSFNPTSVNFTGANSPTTTLTISTLPTMTVPASAQNVTITPVSPSNVSTSVTLTVTKTTETFSIASTNGLTFPVSPGGTASVSIAVSSSTGFINTSNNTTAVPVTYSCSGIPTTAEIACNFSPGNGQSISQTAVTLNLVTTAATAQSRPPLGRASRVFYALLLPGLFGIVFLGGSRTRSVRLLSLIVVLGFSTLWLGACGGGSNSSQKNPGTPAGSYQITVNATTGGAVPIVGTSLTITLTVN
ncbi:MAG: S53 family peptidase [Candidatus Sulfotelmatobacter sp.]